MTKVDHLLAFINQTLNREERTYLAAQIQVHLFTEQIPAGVGNIVQPIDSPAPQNVKTDDQTVAAQVQEIKRPTEYISLFSSMEGRDIQYTFLKKKVLGSKPKTLEKVRNFISSTCSGYGGLSPADLDIVIYQFEQDNLFEKEEDGTLLWK